MEFTLIKAFVCGAVILLNFIFRAYSNYCIRRLFLQIQSENGHYPNDEEKLRSCYLAFSVHRVCSVR